MTNIILFNPHLFERSFPDIENFSLQWEDAVAVPANHSQPRHSKRLG